MANELKYDDIARVAHNPSRAITMILDRVEEALSGKRVKFGSATHPFLVAIDTITSESYGLINRINDAEAKIYPAHSRNTSDLFRHLSDYEFYGLFGYPGNSKMRYAIPMREIKRLAVPYEEQTGQIISRYRKLAIPKDTIIEIYDIPFSIIHGVEFRLMDGGYVQVVYDSKHQHPYFQINSNVLERRSAWVNGEEYLYVDIPVRQMKGETKRKIAVTPSAGLKEVYRFEDKLFGVRAWLTNKESNTTRELTISYNNQVFNHNEVTLTVDVDQDNQQFTYAIPETYINSGKGIGSVTLVVYTTRGDYSQDLKLLKGHKHAVTYLDFDYENNKLDRYSAPIREVNNSLWEIQSPVSGGANPRSFQEIKQSYIANSSRQNTPISEDQFSNYLSRFGYGATKLVDIYTKRLYKLTKELPTITTKDSTNSMSAFISKVMYSLDDLRETGMVYDNINRVTIPPKVIFDASGHNTVIIPKTQMDELSTLNQDQLQDYVNNRLLVYTPYHTVVDTSGNTPNLRPYLLDNPLYDNQNFIYENDSLGVELGVDKLQISFNDKGYRLLMITRSDDYYKGLSDESLGAQLYIKPADSNEIGVLKGKVIGRTENNERIFSFDLESNFDVDNSDHLSITNMNMFNRPVPSVKINLKSDVRVLFLIEGNSTSVVSKQDQLIDRTLFSETMTTLIEVGYDIIFGKPLRSLYSRIHPVLGEGRYKRYEEDVPELWPEDMFKRDENGEYVFDENDKLILEHRAGTPMVVDGKPVIRHYKNSLVYNDDGKPVLLEPGVLKYYMDLVCFDGKYNFTTDQYDLDFAGETKSFISQTIMQDMENFQSQMRDATTLLFSPKVKLGLIDVVINSQYETRIRGDLNFNVVFYLNEAGVRSDTLRTALRRLTSQVINDQLMLSTISNSQILEALKKVLPGEVIDVRINSFSEDMEIDVVSTLNGSESFSVRKRLETTGAGVSSVNESISYSFLPHFKNK